MSRTTELRAERIALDETARRFIDEAGESEEIHIVAHRPGTDGGPEEYA